MHLLDTSALLWTLTGSKHLGRRSRRILRNSSAVYASSISVAEIAIKSMVGKLRAPADLDQLLAANGLVELPVTARHAAAITRFPALARHDPFDRLLVAQAAVERLTLLTGDQVLLGLGLDFVADARD